jgi:hypothetical protein
MDKQLICEFLTVTQTLQSICSSDFDLGSVKIFNIDCIEDGFEIDLKVNATPLL